MESVLSYLPQTIREQLKRVGKQGMDQTEEIRIRVGRPIEINIGGKTHFLPKVVEPEVAEQLLNNLGKHSFYTLDEELKRGYITIEGGHRVGLAGKVVLEKGEVKAIRDISSFNIRIAREQLGIAEPLIPYLFDGTWHNTIIIGPPQTGKTSLLRDLARIISSGHNRYEIPPMKTCIIDERSEIAGCVNGVPQLTFGPRIDVLDGCPKAEGMMMMIRSMSPDVIVVDEIGRKEDSEAIQEAIHAGIRLVMTTHGENIQDLLQRPTLKPIMDQKVFDRYVILSRKKGPGTVNGIYDRNLKPFFLGRVFQDG